jgi:hypothetical protein
MSTAHKKNPKTKQVMITTAVVPYTSSRFGHVTL